MNTKRNNTGAATMNTIDITDYTDAELDALLGILPDEADMTAEIGKAYLKGVYHRDIVDLRNQVAAGEMTAEDAALWANLQHGGNHKF